MSDLHPPSFSGALRALVLIVLSVSSIQSALSEERLMIKLKDFSDIELKSAGFVCPSDMSVHILALGGSGWDHSITNSDMYAYGWIIDADTREPVWIMNRDNTTRGKDGRMFDDHLSLRKGSYEIYFVAYGYAAHSTLSKFNFNIDHRNDDGSTDQRKHRGFLDWLGDLFGGDGRKDWKRHAKDWGIELYADEGAPHLTMFTPPREFQNVVYKATKIGESAHVR